MRVAGSFATLALAVSLAGCGTAAPSEIPSGPQGGSPGLAASSDPSASPAVSDATSAELEQLLAQITSTPVDVSDPGPALDLGEQGLKDFMRQVVGVAELLGPDGAAILAEMDVAEKEGIDALVARVQAQAVAPGAGGVTATATVHAAGTIPGVDVARQQAAPLAARLASVATRPPPGGSGPRQLESEGEYLFGIYLITGMAPAAFADAPRDNSGNYAGPSLTMAHTTEHGATNTLTMTPTLHGSRMTADLKLDSGVARGPLMYQEQATGTVAVDLCPDVNGNVALEVSLGYKVSLLGGGIEFNVKVRETGQVDESGRLASTGEQLDATMASQPLTGNDALGTAPMYVEYTSSYAVDPGGAISSQSQSVPRYSSHLDLRIVREGIDAARSMGRLVAAAAMGSAEGKWTTGYCVAITVAEMTGTSNFQFPSGETRSVPHKLVDVGSETPFTAAVTHKFEGGQLRVPVTATLTSGDVSVTPSGTGVPAPAPFRYKAPAVPRKEAVVTLATRSRRGIASLTVVFQTTSTGWVYAPGSALADGKHCDSSVDGDWVVNVHSGAGGMTGKYVVTIDQVTDSGTYVYDMLQVSDGATATWHGTGHATIVLNPDDWSVAMSFHGGTTTITIKTPSGSNSGTMPGPEGQQFLWQPAGSECR